MMTASVGVSHSLQAPHAPCSPRLLRPEGRVPVSLVGQSWVLSGKTRAPEPASRGHIRPAWVRATPEVRPLAPTLWYCPSKFSAAEHAGIVSPWGDFLVCSGSFTPAASSPSLRGAELRKGDPWSWPSQPSGRQRQRTLQRGSGRGEGRRGGRGTEAPPRTLSTFEFSRAGVQVASGARPWL